MTQKFSETLKELLDERGLNNKQFSKLVGISEACISLYIKNNNVPSVSHLIKIAEYFQCSTDFLLGREQFKENLSFNVCPSFGEQVCFLEKYMNFTPKDFYSRERISKSSYFDWKYNKRKPTLDSVIALAEICERRVDFILGRES
ncbi:MAG: helix-turn-helix domain-containing protein [Clostridiales bacterium]|nr:helix-turn-helix domain-containing protein [Clostridiales bacterium]